MSKQEREAELEINGTLNAHLYQRKHNCDQHILAVQ